jgi:Family of unknown function (DUF6325)
VPEDHVGPLDYVVVQFSAASSLRAGLDRLLALVEAGLIRVLDLEFVTNTGGAVRTITASEAAAELADFDGASSRLLDRDDVNTLAADLTPDTFAAVLVYEELSILQVVDAWERAGARTVSQGPVEVDDIDAALEEVR